MFENRSGISLILEKRALISKKQSNKPLTPVSVKAPVSESAVIQFPAPALSIVYDCLKTTHKPKPF